MAFLYLAASQKENIENPYEFPMSGIRVYSLEEALYFCFKHWRQSMDFLNEQFIHWIESVLGLGQIAAKLRDICRIESFSMRFLAFLSVTDYLPKEELAGLQKELILWEKRQVWEQLKEQGDYWSLRGASERALGFYSKALAEHENLGLLNNCGVALMQMGNYDNAAALFLRALRLEPKNKQMHFNLIEAYIFAEDYESAQSLLEETYAKYPDHPELFYLQGEIYFNKKNYFEAIKLYEKAIKLNYDEEYIYKLCDCFIKIRLYDKALSTIQNVANKDITFLRKQAEYYVIAGNVPMAIKSIEKALTSHSHEAELWIILAQYHRLDYDNAKAGGAITRALALSPENPAALLERARVEKVQGRIKDYQSVLNRILARFKKDYREYNL